jgi:hypothetical protein
MSSISWKHGETLRTHGSKRYETDNELRALKTANELRGIIVEQAAVRYDPRPAGMTLFVFDDAYGRTASISRPTSDADDFYRTWGA